MDTGVTTRHVNIIMVPLSPSSIFSLSLSIFSSLSLSLSLSLSILSLPSPGAIALAEVLAESKHLTELDLKENDIRVAGLMALQLAHRMNKTLVGMETPKSYRVEQVSQVFSV